MAGDDDLAILRRRAGVQRRHRALHADAEGAVPLSPSVPDARRGAAAHRGVHHPLQRRVAHRAARPSDAGGRSGRGTGGVAMLTLRTRSLSAARINDRREGHTLTSPASVQETGCGTGLYTAYALF